MLLKKVTSAPIPHIMEISLKPDFVQRSQIAIWINRDFRGGLDAYFQTVNCTWPETSRFLDFLNFMISRIFYEDCYQTI